MRVFSTRRLQRIPKIKFPQIGARFFLKSYDCFLRHSLWRSFMSYWIKGTVLSRGLKKSCFFLPNRLGNYSRLCVKNFSSKFEVFREIHGNSVGHVHYVRTYITKSKVRFLKTMFLHFAGKITKKVPERFS